MTSFLLLHVKTKYNQRSDKRISGLGTLHQERKWCVPVPTPELRLTRHKPSELARTILIAKDIKVRARCQTALTSRATSPWPAGRGLWPSWKRTAEKTSRITVRLYSKDCSDTRCSCCGHRVDKESQEQSRTQQNSNILMCVVRVTITLWFENMNNYEHFPVWPQIIIISSCQTRRKMTLND